MPTVLLPADILRAPVSVGPKARALAKLAELGFHIPAFVAVTAEAVATLRSDPAAAERLAAEARSMLPEKRYVVRSAGFTEDSAASSRAGAFCTELDVAPEALAQAIQAVATDAVLQGEERFSLIIQAFIPCDVSGVTFTRSPLGGREMAVEWHKGLGPDLVGGKVAPARVVFHRTQALPRTGLPDFAYAVREWKRIEEAFGFPQDIEWGIWKKDWYVLQSRPVTSLTEHDHRMFSLLDRTLPKEPFLYEKTEVTEMAPCPSTATLSLLRRIYRTGGPVDTAYAELGFRYRADDFLVLVAGQLYVDREKELRTILPSFSHVTRSGSPTFRRLQGFWTTVHNVGATQKVDPHAALPAQRLRIVEWLARAQPDVHLQDALRQFDEAYAVIVAVNVCAAKALTSLQRAVQGEPVHVPTLLTAALFPLDPLPPPPRGLLGNTLELSDLSPLFASASALSPHFETTRWWEALAAEKRTSLEPLIRSAQAYSALREAGRWLTVTLVQTLRDAVLRSAKTAGLDHTLAYDATLEEHLAGNLDASRCAERHAERVSVAAFALPPRLSHRAEAVDAKDPVGVSPGTATGLLVTPEMLPSAAGPVILAVSSLSPDLTRHFGRVGGIVAEHGGLLSHLAIVARERRLPVVANFPLSQRDVRPGDVVDLNGTTGEVRVLKKGDAR